LGLVSVAHCSSTREADDLIQGGSELDLTASGRAEYESLRQYISGPSVEPLSQFDIQDIETTVRTLQAITAHATA
jgi:hypothetical protein